MVVYRAMADGAGCCHGCWEGVWKLLRPSSSPLAIDVEALGLLSDLNLGEEGKERFVRLAAALERIDERRSAADRADLAKLVQRYEAAHGRAAGASLVSGLPAVEPTSPTGEPYKELPLPGADSRPLLDGSTSTQMLEHLQCKSDEPLHPHFVAGLLELVRSLHQKRSRRFGAVMRLDVPGAGSVPQGAEVHEADEAAGGRRVVVLGDTHGQVADFLWALAHCGTPSGHNVYVVNGDIADKSYCSCEIFALLFTFMLQYPTQAAVVVNRGNHECLAMNGSRCGGFAKELLSKYGPTWGPYLHQLFGSVFALLPLATVVHGSVLVLHGGVGRNPEEHFKRLQEMPDECRMPEVNGWGVQGDANLDAMEDALWADPSDTPGSQPNERGNSHVWGPDYTQRFLKSSGLKLIVRSHQVPCDLSGVYVHEAHGSQLITVFTASNYGGHANRGGALVLQGNGSELEFVAVDLSKCPAWAEVQRIPLLSGTATVGRMLLHSNRRKSLQRRNSAYNQKLRKELLQQTMGLLVEFRVPLWHACTQLDSQLQGQLTLRSWIRVCRSTTREWDVDWALVARLTGNVTASALVLYMDLLNRFSFRIASQVVARDPAAHELARLFENLMRADATVQRRVAKLCRRPGARARDVQQLLADFCELLQQNGASSAGVGALRRSLEAHIIARGAKTLDVAEFFSLWCSAWRGEDSLRLRPELAALARKLSRLLGCSVRSPSKRTSLLLPASAASLMDFFTAADAGGDGLLPVEQGLRHLQELLAKHGQAADETGLRELLLAADVNGDGCLNYLEFIRLFDWGGAQLLTHQSLLDALCFQVWSHRSALSGLFRYVGVDGRVSREQVAWALTAVDELAGGNLAHEDLEALMEVTNFGAEGTVIAEEFLHAFEIFDARQWGGTAVDEVRMGPSLFA